MREVQYAKPCLPTIDRVISVCSARDLSIWSVASRHVLNHIAAARYIVIVPNADVALFEAQQISEFEVIPETAYVGDLHQKLIEHIPRRNAHRAGWYVQQFIKLQALLDGISSSYSLVWDADTIPLQNLEFIDAQGRLIFYKGHETHAPYFAPIKKVLGLGRQVPFSFIAQCLPYKSDWAVELRRAIEQQTQSDWIDGLLGSIDFTQESGFSEYELLGTFAYRHHKDEIRFTDRPWFRYGGTLLGHPANLHRWPYDQLLKRYDFVSIESWDADKNMPRWLNCLNALRKEWMTKGRL